MTITRESFTDLCCVISRSLPTFKTLKGIEKETLSAGSNTACQKCRMWAGRREGVREVRFILPSFQCLLVLSEKL